MSSSSVPRRPPSSRPTTPLRQLHRPSSRSSLRSSRPTTPINPNISSAEGVSSSSAPLINTLEPAFAELADSMADLEANWMHLQLLHESLGRFGEDFAGFLYGLNLVAFCVDFPEAPIPESTKRMRAHHQQQAQSQSQTQSTTDPSNLHVPFTTGDARPLDVENTFMTSDTSFISHPPPLSSTKGTPGPALREPVTPAPVRRGGRGRGTGEARGGGRGIPVRGGRGRAGAGGAARGARGSGLPGPTITTARGRGRGGGGGEGRGR